MNPSLAHSYDSLNFDSVFDSNAIETWQEIDVMKIRLNSVVPIFGMPSEIVRVKSSRKLLSNEVEIPQWLRSHQLRQESTSSSPCSHGSARWSHLAARCSMLRLFCLAQLRMPPSTLSMPRTCVEMVKLSHTPISTCLDSRYLVARALVAVCSR